MLCQSKLRSDNKLIAIFRCFIVYERPKLTIKTNIYIFKKPFKGKIQTTYCYSEKMSFSSCLFSLSFPVLLSLTCYVLCLKCVPSKPHVHTIMWLASRKYFLKMLFYILTTRDQMPHPIEYENVY